MAAGLNIQQGARKQVQILGLKEMQKRLKEIRDASVGRQAADLMFAQARALGDRMRQNADAVNMPSLAMRDFFIFGQQPASMSAAKKVSALAGLRKMGRDNRDAHGYRTWRASRQLGAYEKTSRSRRRHAQLRIAGTQIGENLATMWEFGTTKMPARPWFRPAIAAMRNSILTNLAEGYRRILEEHGA